MTTFAPSQETWVEEMLSGVPVLSTITEVTGVLRCSRSTVIRLIKIGKLSALKSGSGGRVLVTKAALAHYLRGLKSA